MDKPGFRKLKIEERYRILRDQGEYIGARIQGSHRVHLFSFSGFFVEVWILISLNQVHWIEIQENQAIINEYTRDIDVRKDLGL
jgi:hypothetical protein